VTDRNQLDLIGRQCLLSVPLPGKCARCHGEIKPFFEKPAIYLGKAEDEVFREVRGEYRFLEPIRCVFCGGFIVTYFINVETVIRNERP
jgi:hypothetical protein